jgi:phosphatidate cytidylyltransferase
VLDDPGSLFDEPPPGRGSRRDNLAAPDPDEGTGVFVPPGAEEEGPGDFPPPGAQRPRGRRARFETLARALVAVPWIVFAIVIIVVGGVPFTIAMVGLATLGLVEFFRMTADARPFVPVGFAVVAAVIIAAHYTTGRTAALIAGLSFPLMFAFAAGRPARQGVTISFGVTLLAIAWIGAPFAHAVLLRDLPLHGGALLIDVLVATFLADTAAYLGGRLFGRHPLAPSLSPNKTIEGLFAGFVGGTIGFWFAGLYQDWLSGTDALVMGACIALVAPVGDLFESMIKRDLGVKDTGRAFGPHGGLLDRLDAVLFTIVAGFYLSIAFVY